MQRNPALIAFQEEVNKKFGANAVRFASDLISHSITRIPTGSISLDMSIGGGIPVGRFVQIAGDLSSTKSSLCYKIIANAQKMYKLVPDTSNKKSNKKLKKKEDDSKESKVAFKKAPLVCMLIQPESNSFTKEYAELLGVNVSALIFNENAGMEEALEIAHLAQKNGIVDVIVIDSLEALVPMKELTSSMDDTVQMGIKPKLFAEYFRKFQATNNKLVREDKHPCTVIGINQLREKIGAYGDPEYTPGGRAIGFTASLDIRLKKGDLITIGAGANKQAIGRTIKYKVFKNKVGVPLRTGSYDWYLDDGGPVPAGNVDNFKEIVMEGVDAGIIHRGGAWYSYGDVKVQGQELLIDILKEREDLFEEIREKLMEMASNIQDAEEFLQDEYNDEEEDDISINL